MESRRQREHIGTLQEGVLRLSVLAGELCLLFKADEEPWKACALDGDLVNNDESGAQKWREGAREIAKKIVFVVGGICDLLGNHLVELVRTKITINEERHPPGSESYTRVGTAVDNTEERVHSVIDFSAAVSKARMYSGTNREEFFDVVDELTAIMKKFMEDRALKAWYTPTKITLALISEVGELARSLQWVKPDVMLEEVDTQRLVRVLEEVADVAICCLHIFMYEE